MSLRDLAKERIKRKIGLEVDPRICKVEKDRIIVPQGNKHLKIKDEVAAFYISALKHPEILDKMEKRRLISHLYNLRSIRESISFKEFEKKMEGLTLSELREEIRREEEKAKGLDTFECIKVRMYLKFIEAAKEIGNYSNSIVPSYQEWEEYVREKPPEYLLKLNTLDPHLSKHPFHS